MKLLVSQLPEGETAFHFESPKEGWIQEVIRHVARDGYEVQGTLQLDVKLTKWEPDYYLRGKTQFNVSQVCARCAEGFVLPVTHSFDVALAHLESAKALSPPPGDDGDELDITYFEGPELDLGPLLEEQFFLSLPYQALCRADCRGICQQCGKNKNSGDCGCRPPGLNPFSQLQQMRLQ